MLGYIRPYKPEMKLKEFEVYKGIYCGLCKQLGKVYGPFARMTLSYDFAFLSMLGMAINDKEAVFEKQRCVSNPLKKKNVCVNTEDMEFTSAVAMLMIYYKLKDNFQDLGIKNKLLSYGAYPFIKPSYKKSREQLPVIENAIAEMTAQQYKLEKAHCASVDEAAEPTAKAMQLIAGLLSDDAVQKRVLTRFGYLLGRWVYLIDALDDIEDDIKKENYNPFIMKYGLTEIDCEQIKKIKQEAKPALYLTIAEIGKTYELLNINRYKTILDNIIYLGLKDSVDKVFVSDKTNQREEENDE
ncbi:MAG: DUF5685 family protein [Oscillospiraceae bacterium]